MTTATTETPTAALMMSEDSLGSSTSLGSRQLLVLLTIGFLFLVPTMIAQTSSKSGAAPRLTYGMPITIENAKRVAALAIAEGEKNGWDAAVAIVDIGGNLVYFEKRNDTQVGSADVAIAKARSAVLFKRPTRIFQDQVASGGAGLRILGLAGAVPLDGGVPLVVRGQIVGAIGVSGDTSEHDGLCAKAGADVLQQQ